MTPYHFPDGAFLPAQTLPQKLAAFFNARSYGPDSIRSIRSAVYYSDFELFEFRLRYVASVAHALRHEDGLFSVYTSTVRITEDPIRKSLAISSADNGKERDDSIICDQASVLKNLLQVEKTLQEKANYAIDFPRDIPLRLSDDLHISAAQLIFDRPATREEILYRQQLSSYRDLQTRLLP